MELRPYQQECIDKSRLGFKDFQRQLAVMATGSGKTIMAAKLMERAVKKGHRCLFLAHRDELITQAQDKILQATGIKSEIEKAEQKATPQNGPGVVVGSIQTMARRLERWPKDEFGLVIADEAHHSVSDSWQRVLNHFNAPILGMTATADRSDKKNLGTFYENIPYEISMFDLIRQGFLAEIKILSVPLGIDISNVSRVAGDYKLDELGKTIEAYLDAAAKAIVEYAQGRKVLVFLPLIKTSQKFVEICLSLGLAAEHVDGKDKERKEKLARFASGETMLLANAMLVSEGFDVPTIDCVVVLRPTQSRPLFAQMVGRGTRIAPDKENLLILDFLWQHEKHPLMRAAHLIAEDEDIANHITESAEAQAGEEVDLEDLHDTALDAREESLRKKLQENEKRDKRLVDASELCLSLKHVMTADFEPTVPWHSQGVSDGQLKIIQKFGIDPETVQNKGKASAVIDILLNRQAAGLATPRQVKFLKRFRHPSPDKATFTEATAFLDVTFAKKSKRRKPITAEASV